MINEKQVTAKTLTSDIIKYMTYVGCNPKIRTFTANVIGYIHTAIPFILTVLMACYFLFKTHNSLSSIMDDIVMFSGFIQISAKFYYTITKANLLSNILSTVWDQFWSTDALDLKSKQHIQLFYKIANVGGKIFQMFITICACLIVVRASMKANNALVLEIWIPYEKYLRLSPYYEIIFVLEGILYVLYVYCLVSPIDRLFVVLTICICVQFKMICINLLKIGPQYSVEENNEIIRKNAEHHGKILRFTKDFEDIYSKLFFPTLCTSFVMLSLSMYGFMMEDELEKRIAYAISICIVLLQIFLYYIAGQFIQDEGLKIYNAAYNCKWYDMNNQQVVQKSLIQIIIQAQSKLELTVGGIFGLSIYNFAGVIRASFSFMMFLINSRSIDTD